MIAKRTKSLFAKQRAINQITMSWRKLSLAFQSNQIQGKSVKQYLIISNRKDLEKRNMRKVNKNQTVGIWDMKICNLNFMIRIVKLYF